MAKWLFKSEPETWGWADQVARGASGEPWDGVRNYQARNFMRQMTIGDLGFFYHSQKDKAIVGIVKIIAEAHPDPSTEDPRWECVDIQAIMPLAQPITLDDIKSDPKLVDMALVKQARLSVQPVTEQEWDHILSRTGTKIPPN
ncbi:MAG: EVE domain-containing protein [Paracoccaceae bacterium]